MSVTYRASINNLPDKSRSSAGRTVHEGHGNRNDTDEVIQTDNGSSQSHLLCPVLLLLFITEIILLLTLLYFTLLYFVDCFAGNTRKCCFQRISARICVQNGISAPVILLFVVFWDNCVCCLV